MRYILAIFSLLFVVPQAHATDFKAWVPGLGSGTFPCGATDYYALVPNGAGTVKVPCNSIVTLTDTQTLTNKTLTSPTINGAALSGTLSGTPTLSGNLTFSGVPIYSGLSSGTQTKCLGLDASNNLVYNAAACGSGGSSTGFGVDGGTSAASVTGTGTIGNGVRLVKIASGWTTGTLTLPAISAVSSDSAICFDDGGSNVSGSATLTIAANAADSINGGSAGGSIGAYTSSGVGFCLRVSATHNWTVESGATIPAFTCASNNFANQVGINGLVCAQPAFSNLSGSNSAAQIAGSAASHAVPVDVGGTPTWKVVPDCQDSGGNHINYTQSTDAFSCGTTSSGGAGSVPRSYMAGLIVSNDGTTPNSVLDISAGQAADSTNAVLMSASAFTKSTAGAWASGTGSNGMGNGLTIASATTYFVCMANNGGTPDFYFDTSATCANRPSGISDTKVRVVNAFLTCNSAGADTTAAVGICAATNTNIAQFVQRATVGGVMTFWSTLPRDQTSQTVSATRTSFALTVPSGIRVVAMINASMSGGAAAGIIIVSPDEPDTVIGATAAANVVLGDQYSQNAQYVTTYFERLTNTSAQVAVKANATGTNGLGISTRGWRWDRGVNG